MRFSWDRAINRNQGWRPTTVFERWLVLGLGSFNITPLETEQHVEFWDPLASSPAPARPAAAAVCGACHSRSRSR